MKTLSFLLILSLSSSLFASPDKSMVCHDTEFGAGHLKVIIPDLGGFFAPRETKPVVKAEFWVKGQMYPGIMETTVFMADWGDNSGWYRSSPSPLDFSMCNWRKCPVRKIKLMVHTKDQLKAEGNIKFLLQTADRKKTRFDRKLSCEIK